MNHRTDACAACDRRWGLSPRAANGSASAEPEACRYHGRIIDLAYITMNIYIYIYVPYIYIYMSLQVSVSGFIDVVYIYIHHIPYTIRLIVGYIWFYYIYTGWWLTYPSEKYMTSSVRMMTIPSWMKIMFQTTNQYILPWSSHVYIPWNIIPMFMVQRDDHGIYQPSGFNRLPVTNEINRGDWPAVFMIFVGNFWIYRWFNPELIYPASIMLSMDKFWFNSGLNLG